MVLHEEHLMINEGPFDRYQFVISSELLQLLEWLIDHEQENLKKLIKRAVQQDFITYKNGHVQNRSDDLQQSIIDFFILVDMLLHDALHEDEAQDALQRALIPALNHLDKNMYDSQSVETSIAKARAAATDPRGKDPKEILFKELLRRWKPSKKLAVN